MMRTPFLGACLAAALSLLSLGCRSAGAAVIYERDSSYHHIVVEDNGNKRTLFFDNAPQSQMDRDDTVSGAFEYTDFFHCAYLFNPAIKDVLFIGLGGGSAPKRFLADYPAAQIDAVDVDPEVITVAERFFSVKRGPRLRLFARDGRRYLKLSSRMYDMIVVDAYTRSDYGSTIPAHLTTREFFRLAAEHLRPGGVIAYNVIAQTTGYGSEMTRALLKTMQTTYSTPYLFLAESSRNTVIFAFKGAKHTLDEKALVRKAEELVREGKVKLPNFARRAGRSVPVPDVSRAILLTDDNAPVDRLLRSW